MNDSEEWALSWLADLVGPNGPGLTRPVVVHDRLCAGLATAHLPEQLRELRRPIENGVPKNGRYAVVYERPWDGRECVWLEAAEYAFGMFGARFLFVQPVRRSPDGALVADGEPRELTERDLAESPPSSLGITARAAADSLRSGARNRLEALRRAGKAAGPAMRARARLGEHAVTADPLPGDAVSAQPVGGAAEPATLASQSDVPGPEIVAEQAIGTGPADAPEPVGPAEPAVDAGPGYPAEHRSLRERLAGLPTALIVAIWIGVLLLGVVSAMSLTELASSSRAAAKARVAEHSAEHSAGQTANLRPASTAIPAAPPARAAAPDTLTPAAPAPGDLGLRVPISRPACDGGYGVIVANATRPGAYRHEIEEFLARFSGASYLLAERACSSLRSHTEDGSSIYAVYYGPYPALGNACATRSRIGGGSYVRKLDNGPESSLIIKC